jgi:hypothetical protein
MPDDNVISFKKAKRAHKAAEPKGATKPPKRYPPVTVAFVVCVVGYLCIGAFGPWPPLTTLRHLAAAPSCATARAVGLAPAHIGEPGYWSFHDEGRSGIACAIAPNR